MPATTPGARDDRLSGRRRAKRAAIKAALLWQLERLAPQVLLELERCYPAVEEPGRWRRGRRVVSGHSGWPEFDAWAERWRLRIDDPRDGWLIVWAWGRRGMPWAPILPSTEPFLEQAAGHRRPRRVSLRAFFAKVTTKPWDAEFAAECFVRRQILRQSWAAIASEFAAHGRAISRDGIRSAAGSAADLLSIPLAPGRRGAPVGRRRRAAV